MAGTTTILKIKVMTPLINGLAKRISDHVLFPTNFDIIVQMSKYSSSSTQTFSAMKSHEQLLTDSQCERYDHVDINYFIGPKVQRKRCRQMEEEKLQLN